MASQASQAPPNMMQKLLTVADVAEILGISKTTAKIWASQRVFPVVKIGRLIRISPQALEHWIMQKTEERRGEAEKKNNQKSKTGKLTFDKYVESLKSEKKH
ncbi:MAG: helix-turn-helix domain-containing protein [Candidatus Aminicenantes bacterium]|nr:helix-turn-helix domain-containing protein [Candidatus Aminicenantes bacterium]